MVQRGSSWYCRPRLSPQKLKMLETPEKAPVKARRENISVLRVSQQAWSRDVKGMHPSKHGAEMHPSRHGTGMQRECTPAGTEQGCTQQAWRLPPNGMGMQKQG